MCLADIIEKNTNKNRVFMEMETARLNHRNLSQITFEGKARVRNLATTLTLCTRDYIR